MFKKGDKVIHTLTFAKVEVIEVLPKQLLYTQQVKGKCLRSTIIEDIGQIFEYDINSLKKIK